MLVEPAGPLNVGSVARLCANFGIDQLRLVAPRCDPLAPESWRMAVKGQALLESAPRFLTLAAAVADCRRVVATSGRLEQASLPFCSPRHALAWLLGAEQPSAEWPASGAGATGTSRSPAALVFGREDRGLSNDELLQAGRLLRIGTASDYPSLNLSHAVAVVLHELHELRHGVVPVPEGPSPSSSPVTEPCPRRELEEALADAEALLLEVGFLYPHTAHARMSKLRALLQRAQVGDDELALLRGMVCQLRWASRRLSPPGQGL